ncbi:MAG: phage tail length tape measure family protein [Saprospiraceae bacterium]|nr:phage tail length tape measure family protein [Saprospiraceae bacterium]
MAATRTLGFRLEVKGSTDTINQLDAINKKLEETRSKIKDVTGKKISLSTSFDQKGISELIGVLSKVQTTKLNPELTGQIKLLQAQLLELKSSLKQAQAELTKLKSPDLSSDSFDKLNVKIDKTSSLADAAKSSINALKPGLENVDSSDFDTLIKKLVQVELRLTELRNLRAITVKADLPEIEKTGLLEGYKKEIQGLEEQSKQLNRVTKLQTQEFINQANNIPIDSIVGLRNSLSQLTLTYDKLSEVDRNTDIGKNLNKQINETKNKISEAEESTGRFQRNVGNYKGAVLGLIPELDKLQREGLLAGSSLTNVVKADLAAKAKSLEVSIASLGAEFRELGTDIKGAADRAGLLEKIEQQVRELTSIRGSIDQTGNSFTKLSGKLLSVSDIISGGLIGGGIIASIGALKAFGGAAITEFTQAETALAKINQQLLITGNASGQSADGLQAIAKDFEVLTGIDGDKILSDVTSSLLKFTRIQGEVFKDAQKSALDLSVVMGGDLAGATNLLGKALDNPIKGLTLLAKQGISLDAATQKQVKNAIAQNDIYKAQSIILTEVNKKFGGLATAVNSTDLKGIRQLTVDFNNFKESVGKGLISSANSILTFFKDVSLGVNVFDKSRIVLERGIKGFEDAAAKEIVSIKGITEALKDETLSREGRDALIKELVNKYPGLIDQYDLEYASIKRLDEIQADLTKTVLSQIKERLKAQTNEAIQVEQINKSIEIAHLKAGRLTTGQRFAAGLVGQNQDQAVKTYIAQKEKEIKDLKKQQNEVEKTFNESDRILAEALGLPQTNSAIDNTEKVNTRIKAVIGETAKILKDEKASKEAKAYAQKLNIEFTSIQKELAKGGLSEERRALLLRKSESSLKELSALSAKRIKLATDSSEAELKNQESAAKALEDQLKRIQDLKNKIAELNIGSIQNDFDQKIETIKLNTKKQVDEIQAKLDSLVLKPVKTKNDQLEIENSEKLIKALGEEENRQIGIINKDREKLINEATKKLIKAREDVLLIIKEVNNTDIEIKIKDQQFNLDQQKRIIEVEFRSNLDKLNAEFAAGLITEKEYTDKSTKLEIDKFDTIDKLINGAKDEFLKNLQIRYKAESDLIEQTKKQQIAAIKAVADADNLQVNIDFQDGKIASLEAAQAAKIAIAQKASTEIVKIESDNAKKRLELDQRLTIDTNAIIDQGVEAHRAGEEKKTENKSIENAKRVALEKEKLKLIIDSSIALFEELSATLFEIENSRSEQRFEREKTFLEKEYANRIKLAAGNSDEIIKLERERDARLQEIEKEQAKRRQKQAISQAIINASLAIIKVFVDPGGILAPILALSIAATTAIQIAKIKAQGFAKGAYFNAKGQGGYTGSSQAPPDETGHRPIGTGILHVDEYIATAKQTKTIPTLFEALDKDRIKTNSGQPSTIFNDIEEMVDRRRKAIFNIPKPASHRHEQIIPIILPFGGNKAVSKLEFTEDQIEQMASIMADKIALKSGQAIYSGSRDGLIETTKEILRSERTTKRATA